MKIDFDLNMNIIYICSKYTSHIQFRCGINGNGVSIMQTQAHYVLLNTCLAEDLVQNHHCFQQMRAICCAIVLKSTNNKIIMTIISVHENRQKYKKQNK